jgi:hypothetical protein
MSVRPKSADELLRILRDPRSVPDVRTYFNLDRPDDASQYAELGSSLPAAAHAACSATHPGTIVMIAPDTAAE